MPPPTPTHVASALVIPTIPPRMASPPTSGPPASHTCGQSRQPEPLRAQVAVQPRGTARLDSPNSRGAVERRQLIWMLTRGCHDRRSNHGSKRRRSSTKKKRQLHAGNKRRKTAPAGTSDSDGSGSASSSASDSSDASEEAEAITSHSNAEQSGAVDPGHSLAATATAAVHADPAGGGAGPPSPTVGAVATELSEEAVLQINHDLRNCYQELGYLAMRGRNAGATRKAAALEKEKKAVADALKHWNNAAYHQLHVRLPECPVDPADGRTNGIRYPVQTDVAAWFAVQNQAEELDQELERLYKLIRRHPWASWVIPDGTQWQKLRG